MTLRQKAMLGLVIVAMLWGSAGVVAKLLVERADVYVILFYRFGIASLLIFPFFLAQPKPKGYLQTLIPLSFLNSLNAFFFYIGLSKTTANATYIINTTFPVVITLLASMLIGEHPSRNKILGICISLIGALFIVLLPLLMQGQATHGDFIGNLFIFAALISFSLYTVGSRNYLKSEKFTPLLTAAMNFFTTTASCLIVVILSGRSLFVPSLADTNYLTLLLYAAAPMTLVTFSLLQWVLKHIPASTASLNNYIQLIVSFGLNAFFLGETLTIYYFIGTILVVIGVTVATQDFYIKKILSIFKIKR